MNNTWITVSHAPLTRQPKKKWEGGVANTLVQIALEQPHCTPSHPTVKAPNATTQQSRAVSMAQSATASV